MKWNFFSRLANLENMLSVLTEMTRRMSNQHNDWSTELDYRVRKLEAKLANTDARMPQLQVEPVPESRAKQQTISEYKKEYYLRNRDKILAQQRNKQKTEKRRQKMREYAKARYWRLKAEKAKAKPVDQPHFISAA
jgi:hypothetical protein